MGDGQWGDGAVVGDGVVMGMGWWGSGGCRVMGDGVMGWWVMGL